MAARLGGGGAMRALAICVLLAVAVTEAALPSLIEQRVERAVASGFTTVRGYPRGAPGRPEGGLH